MFNVSTLSTTYHNCLHLHKDLLIIINKSQPYEKYTNICVNVHCYTLWCMTSHTFHALIKLNNNDFIYDGNHNFIYSYDKQNDMSNLVKAYDEVSVKWIMLYICFKQFGDYTYIDIFTHILSYYPLIFRYYVQKYAQWNLQPFNYSDCDDI